MKVLDINWVLVFTAVGGTGAIVTAIATVVKLYYIPYRNKKMKNRLREKKELDSKISSLTSTKWQLEQSLNEKVRPSKFEHGASVSWFVKDYEERIKEYHEKFNECGDWYEACTEVVAFEHMALVRNEFKNGDASQLQEKLLQVPLVNMYIEGEKVTLTFIKDSYPRFHKDLMEMVKDEKAEKKEQRLSAFFIETNRLFGNHRVLTRFRKKKRALEQFGESIRTDLEKALSNLQQEMSHYDDVKVDVEPLPE
jgi:hypothetical protein